MTASPSDRLHIEHERLVLDNGLQLILHPDRRLPRVVVNLWYRVGSRDEGVGRTGFAHLFEHLMFMGTRRLPDSGFDDLMEARGGSNNAWTSEDATDYYDVGPSRLLETFLWMEADRMEELGRAMTAEKLDLQRDVVRNERRQSYENAPYGGIWLALPEALYGDAHPYGHPVIGSHEDLVAATLDDVRDFFDTWYRPSNASLVIAGDFGRAQALDAVHSTFGRLPQRPGTPRRGGELPSRPLKEQVELEDDVQLPMSLLAWHSPAVFEPGDADLDLLAGVLAEGRSSRLYRSLVHERGVALEVGAHQLSQQLGSMFVLQARGVPGAALPELEGLLREELVRLAEEGPGEEELQRVRARLRHSFLRSLESLQSRASALNRYSASLGDPDGLAHDLGRYGQLGVDQVRAAAARLVQAPSCSLRVLPRGRS